MCNLHWYFSAKENISFWHHSYIFNINVKYTLHLVRLIIQMNRQNTKERVYITGQIVFYCFCPCGIFLIVQTLKKNSDWNTGSRNIEYLLNYSHTGTRNIYRFLTFSFRLYFIVNYTHYIYLYIIILFICLLAISYNMLLLSFIYLSL